MAHIALETLRPHLSDHAEGDFVRAALFDVCQADGQEASENAIRKLAAQLPRGTRGDFLDCTATSIAKSSWICMLRECGGDFWHLHQKNANITRAQNRVKACQAKQQALIDAENKRHYAFIFEWAKEQAAIHQAKLEWKKRKGYLQRSDNTEEGE